jgi:hypothetical protein
MRNQNLGTLFYKYMEPFHDSWEILHVDLWQVAVPLLSADFIWTKLSAECCLYGHHKMSKETALSVSFGRWMPYKIYFWESYWWLILRFTKWTQKIAFKCYWHLTVYHLVDERGIISLGGPHLLMSCSSALPSAFQKSVFAYPKQRATVLEGSVLKWRARPQCLRRQKSVFAYPKQRATLSVGSVLQWCARRQCLRRWRDFCPVHLFVISSTAEVSSRIQNRELHH